VAAGYGRGVPSPAPPQPPTPALPTGTRVLAVDGNSLAHRGFHSGRAEAERGEAPAAYVTGAVVSMLATAWQYGPYDAVVVAFDHADNRRKQEHPGYKAHRPATHPELPGAMAALRTHLADAGFAVVEHPGAEADDLLAAAADACVAADLACDLLSSDRDLTALVGPTVRLLRPRARFAELLVEDVAAVRATYGIEPRQYIDLAALRGDPSDGLVGASGIGPKTAARLVRDHGNIAGIYAALCDLPPRVEASLRAARERVEHNLLVMAPIPHLPVDVAAAVAAGVDPDRVTRTLEALDLAPAARRFVRAVTDPVPRPPIPPPPDDPSTADPVDVARRPPVLRVAAPSRGEQGSLF
jgi:5'-3' exonuclease